MQRQRRAAQRHTRRQRERVPMRTNTQSVPLACDVTPVRIRPNGAPPQTARILIRTRDHITVEPRNLTGMNAAVHPQNRRHDTHKARNRHGSAG
jgi:hypothetical protein